MFWYSNWKMFDFISKYRKSLSQLNTCKTIASQSKIMFENFTSLGDLSIHDRHRQDANEKTIPSNRNDNASYHCERHEDL